MLYSQLLILSFTVNYASWEAPVVPYGLRFNEGYSTHAVKTKKKTKLPLARQGISI